MSMSEKTTKKTYDFWSFFYDRTFGALVSKRLSRATQQFHFRPGDRVLDIGVGTGLTLVQYRHDINVVGMDLSAGMLAKAQARCEKGGLTHCRLVQGDAMLPPFAPQSFDHIMISHTITVVSDPAKLLRWASNLLKPGGRIVLLNHFQSTNPVIAWFERVLNPVFMIVGWRSDLALEDVLSDDMDLSVEYCFQVRTADLWKIVVLTHRKPGQRRAQTLTLGQYPGKPAPA